MKKIISLLVVAVLVLTLAFAGVVTVSADTATNTDVLVLTGEQSKTSLAGTTDEHHFTNELYQDANTDYTGMEWIGFRLKTTGKGGSIVIALNQDDNGLYWPTPQSHINYLITTEGVESSFTLLEQGRVYCDIENFDGYVLISLKDYFVCHPGYTANDADGKLNLDQIPVIRFWHNTSTSDWTISGVTLAKTKDAFLKYYDIEPDDGNGTGTGTGTGTGAGAEKEESKVKGNDNVIVANDDTILVQPANDTATKTAESYALGLKKADNMKYFGFYIKTEAGGSICIGLREKDGSLYWPKTGPKTGYLIAKDGTEAVFSIEDQGRVKFNTAMEGYIVVALDDYMTIHPGHKPDASGKLELSNIEKFEIWHSVCNSDITISHFTFAKTKDDFINYYLKGGNSVNNGGSIPSTGDDRNVVSVAVVAFVALVSAAFVTLKLRKAN